MDWLFPISSDIPMLTVIGPWRVDRLDDPRGVLTGQMLDHLFGPS